MDASNPVELAQALIRCKSVTPDEGGALKLLEKILKDAGFDTHLLVFSEDGTPDVSNLYARIGTPGPGPALAFAGHTDVVPPGDEAAWSSPPFAGEIRDNVLYGRGAVDMKGGVAAMVAAVMRFLSSGGGQSPGSISFLITGDEEGPSVNGMPKLLNWIRERSETIDHCLLAEPSSASSVGDEIKIGRRGSLSGIVTVHGKQGHVAYPKLAENPVRRLLPMLAALMQPLDYGTAHFERSNLEVTSVDIGNETVNIIPARATARFNVRFNDAHTLDSIKALISERLANASSGARHELVFLPGASTSFVTQPGPFVDLIAAAVAEETGAKPTLSTAGGTSDARYIKSICPVVELGLVNATMHQVDERTPVEDIETVTRMYSRILDRYFDRPVVATAPVIAEPEPAETEAAAPEPWPSALSMESELEAALEAELNLTPDDTDEDKTQ